MKFPSVAGIVVVLLAIVVAATSVFMFLQSSDELLGVKESATQNVLSDTVKTPEVPIHNKLNNPPEIIRAVFVTGYSAGSKKYLDYLNTLFKTTEINAVVVDIKGSDGNVSYPGRIKNIDELIKFFHDKNIYVIGRIAVFEDPVYSKANPALAIYNKTLTTDVSKPILWEDNNKLGWLDPASKDVWDRTVSLARDALGHGFDEINFDYVRFPSDGATGDAGFPVYDGKTPKAEVIKSFFQYLRTNLAGKISVDLFGQTTTNTDDMGIGQIIENAFENFDYVCPMVYPSHYVNGFMNFDNPADHPYEIVNYSLYVALARENAVLIKSQVPALVASPLARFRPWLQDFNMGANYTADMVKLEIQATQDALKNNYNGFMLWNPSNIYTQEAILK